MEEKINLLPGFHFTPTDKEVIQHYLKPRIMGHQLPCKVVKDKQLYGPNANPWDLFHVNDDSWIQASGCKAQEKFMFVFVKLTKKAADVNKKKKKKGTKIQFVRKAGCGTWDGQTRRERIKDGQGNVIAEKRMFVFVINQLPPQGYDSDSVVYYNMYEYCLLEVPDFVLCKITIDSSKKPPIVLPSNPDDIAQKKMEKKSTKKNNLEGIPLEKGLASSGKGRKRLATQRLLSENNDGNQKKKRKKTINKNTNKDLLVGIKGTTLLENDLVPSGEGCKEIATFLSENCVDGSISTVCVGDLDHQYHDGFLEYNNYVHEDFRLTECSQNSNGLSGDGGVIANQGSLEYNYGVEDGYDHGLANDIEQFCGMSSQMGIMKNNLLLEYNGGGYIIEEHQELATDGYMLYEQAPQMNNNEDLHDQTALSTSSGLEGGDYLSLVDFDNTDGFFLSEALVYKDGDNNDNA